MYVFVYVFVKLTFPFRNKLHIFAYATGYLLGFQNSPQIDSPPLMRLSLILLILAGLSYLFLKCRT